MSQLQFIEWIILVLQSEKQKAKFKLCFKAKNGLLVAFKVTFSLEYSIWLLIFI